MVDQAVAGDRRAPKNRRLLISETPVLKISAHRPRRWFRCSVARRLINRCISTPGSKCTHRNLMASKNTGVCIQKYFFSLPSPIANPSKYSHLCIIHNRCWQTQHFYKILAIEFIEHRVWLNEKPVRIGSVQLVCPGLVWLTRGIKSESNSIKFNSDASPNTHR